MAWLRLAYDLALRIGELARLDVADVVRKTGGLRIFGKGRKAKEPVTMPQTSCEGRPRMAHRQRPKAVAVVPVAVSREHWPRGPGGPRCLPDHPDLGVGSRRPRVAVRHPPLRRLRRLSTPPPNKGAGDN